MTNGRQERFLKETTDPTLRVEYLEGFDKHSKNLPLKHNGWVNGSRAVHFDRGDLKSLGLDPLYVRVLRIAVRATPKVNQYVDDYANVEVKSFNYKVSNNEKMLKPDDDLAIKVIDTDGIIDDD